jgi:hypothetical protein
LVNVTAPVREVHVYSDGLSQGEVHNRLNALATIVDSRGWAIKNVQATEEPSDRLVAAPAILDDKSAVLDAAPDVFDDSSGTIAAQFDNMIEQSEQQHKSDTLRLVEEARRKVSQPEIQADTTQNLPKQAKKSTGKSTDQDFWFMHTPIVPTDPNLATFQTSAVVAPGAPSTAAAVNEDVKTDITEEELLEAAHKKHERDALQTMSHHEKVIDPNGPQKPVVEPVQNPLPQNETISTMTPPSNPDILKQSLARNNDRSIDSLSREVNKKTDFGDDEVVISLH